MSEQEYISIKDAFGEVVEFTQTFKSNLTIVKGLHQKWVSVDVTSDRTVTLPSLADIKSFPGFRCHLVVKGGGSTLTIARNSNTVRGCLNHGFTTVVDADVVLSTVSNSTLICLFCDGRRWIVNSDASPVSSPVASVLADSSLQLSAIHGSIFTMAATTGVSMSAPPPAANQGKIFKVIITTGGTSTLALTGTGIRAFLMSQNDTSSPTQVSATTNTLTLGGSNAGELLVVQDTFYIASDGSNWHVVGAIGGKAATA